MPDNPTWWGYLAQPLSTASRLAPSSQDHHFRSFEGSPPIISFSDAQNLNAPVIPWTDHSHLGSMIRGLDRCHAIPPYGRTDLLEVSRPRPQARWLKALQHTRFSYNTDASSFGKTVPGLLLPYTTIAYWFAGLEGLGKPSLYDCQSSSAIGSHASAIGLHFA